MNNKYEICIETYAKNTQNTTGSHAPKRPFATQQYNRRFHPAADTPIALVNTAAPNFTAQSSFSTAPRGGGSVGNAKIETK